MAQAVPFVTAALGFMQQQSARNDAKNALEKQERDDKLSKMPVPDDNQVALDSRRSYAAKYGKSGREGTFLAQGNKLG